MKRIIIFSLFLFFVQRSFCQGYDSLDRKARAMADTVNFRPNKSGNWLLYNSFLQLSGKDSAVIEVVVRHDKNIDFTVYQLIGTIKTKSLIPAKAQELSFYLMTDQYNLKIDEKGQCYLRLAKGQLPPGDPVIIPLRVMFSRI